MKKYFFPVLALLQVIVLVLTLLQQQRFSEQMLTVNNQAEIMVEIPESGSPERLKSLQESLEKLPMVKSVEYWSPERSAQYIDRTAFSGYSEFLKKSDLKAPFPPMFRLQLTDIQQKSALEKALIEGFSGQLLLVNSPDSHEGDSFASQFISGLEHAKIGFRNILALQALILLGMICYGVRAHKIF